MREKKKTVTIKEAIIAQLNFCKQIADDIEKHNACDKILQYAKEWAEIESPMTGETDAEWIRICWANIYIYLYLKYDEGKYVLAGRRKYQLDMVGGYGAELIDVKSIFAFMKKLDELTEDEILKDYACESESGDYSDNVPWKYKEYKPAWKILIFSGSDCRTCIKCVQFNNVQEIHTLLSSYEGYWCKIIDTSINKTILEGAFDDAYLDGAYYI